MGVYLAGDSYPRDIHIEHAIQSRTAPIFSRWCSHQDIVDRFPEEKSARGVERRLAALRDIIRDCKTARHTVLFGRSSGWRVATPFAASHSVKAVICLGYPFRIPRNPIEPARYQHLAEIDVPTLILQGRADEYGGSSITLDYQFSKRVVVRLWDCDHEFCVREALGTRLPPRYPSSSLRSTVHPCLNGCAVLCTAALFNPVQSTLACHHHPIPVAP